MAREGRAVSSEEELAMRIVACSRAEEALEPVPGYWVYTRDFGPSPGEQ